jgi:hypothetical protein
LIIKVSIDLALPKAQMTKLDNSKVTT